jgi:hypothetical protein
LSGPKLDKSLILTDIVLIGCSKKLSPVEVLTFRSVSFISIPSLTVLISTAFTLSFWDEALSFTLLPLRSKGLSSYSDYALVSATMIIEESLA